MNNQNDLPLYSAGHIKHEWTSYACMDALFQFFESQYSKLNNKSASPSNKKIKTDL